MNPRWAPLATTGIGSLPFTDDALCLRVASSTDVPFVAEPIQASPQAQLLPRTLAGFVAGRPDLSSLSRSLEGLPAGLIKTQLCGPTTLSVFGGLSPNEAVQWSARVAQDTVALVRSTGRECLLFVDEPAMAVREPLDLNPVLEGARGATVGLHCCGNTDWERVLGLPLEVISFDVRLSLDALLEPSSAWTRFVNRGGALAFGVIPTSPDASFRVDEACEAIEAGLRSTTRDFVKVLWRSLLTTACGLGLSSEAYAQDAMQQLQTAQAILRRNGQVT